MVRSIRIAGCFSAVAPVAAATGLLLSYGGPDAATGSIMATAVPAWLAGFDMDAFGVFFASLLAIVNPVAAIPLFLAFTSDSSNRERLKLALLTAAAVLIAAVVAALFGKSFLGFFSLNVDSLRIAGGIIVLLMGLQLLQSEMSDLAAGAGDAAGAERRRSKIITPLAIPFLLGPGAIATIIIQCESVSTTGGGMVVGAAVTLIAILVLITLIAAQPIARWLGSSGLTVMARIGGMIIAAIAIDMIITGIRNAFPAVA